VRLLYQRQQHVRLKRPEDGDVDGGEEAAFPEVGEVHEEEGVLSRLLLRPADGPGHGLPPDALLPEVVVAV
jgi:hypothetical protein